jgi:zeta-carotene desaturase
MAAGVSVVPLQGPVGRQPRIVIIGGGLAGMAAAVALESIGYSVTLLEARSRLGGRAGSFIDPASGDELDNCQHVLLGCCTNLLDFYRRIGATNRIEFDRSVRFFDSQGAAYALRAAPGLPAPLHLSGSMARFSALDWKSRIELIRAMLAMMMMGETGRLALADVPMGDWLDAHGQSATLVQRMYDPILISSLNEDTRRASAASAIQVFQDALLRNRNGYVIGTPNCPLSQLYSALPCRDVRLATRAGRPRWEGRRISGVELADGAVVAADAVILALAPAGAAKWLSDEPVAPDRRFADLDRLEPVPILGAHLWFDRPVFTSPHGALIDGPLQWIFRKDRDGCAVHGVISAARQWVGRDRDESMALFDRQIRTTFGVPEAKLTRGVIVIEKRATFSPLPGVDRMRPDQAPPPDGIPNLFLAGDYTRTGWPATMEGAVRSGYRAAEAVARAFAASRDHGDGISSPVRFVVEDLPVEWPARLMAPGGGVVEH